MEVTSRNLALSKQPKRKLFTTPQSLELMQPHGVRIATIMRAAQTFFDGGQSQHVSRLSKRQKTWIRSEVVASEQPAIYKGVNFSRIQVADVIRQRDLGVSVEFETLGPYLSDYIKDGGIMTSTNLMPEDVIGFRLSQSFRRLFPQARLISLYDDYNHTTLRSSSEMTSKRPQSFTATEKARFKNSLIRLFKEYGTIPTDAIEGKDFLMIAESSKVRDAEKLVSILETMGYIRHDGKRIVFVNEEAENPLYRKIPLRTIGGHWLCEALDAATYLKSENSEIVHIVVLPEYMKTQLDKVWEIMRVLGIQPHRYHNIFYDERLDSEHVAEIIEKVFLAK